MVTMETETNKLYNILQLCDSAFPTGGFSHSMGIEAAFQNHLIKNEDDLKNVIISSLENVGSSSIPFLKLSHENFKDHLELELLDSLHNSLLLNHVACRASIQQGKSFLNTSCNVFQLPDIRDLQSLVENEKLHGHMAIIFASVCASLQIPAFETGKMFLFNSLRTIISSLVRLGKVGAIQAQNLQFVISYQLDSIISRNWDRLPEDASISFPVIEIVQNTHDTLFSKLFYS